MSDNEFNFDTLAIRTGHQRTPESEHGEPIFPTSSFVFNSAAEAAARFSGEQPGNIYARFTNPTVRIFEQRLAVLEGGESCVATASGMAAIMAVCLAVLKSGDHIVSSRSIFGTTTILFDRYMGKFGVDTTFVDLTDLTVWEQAIQKNTKLLFLETPSNPLTEVADIAALAELAHAHDCLLVVDNCFCTPALQQPLKWGADIIIHSATKYLDGQGRIVGGAVVGNKETVGTDVLGVLRTTGPTMSPFNAWIALKGLETLSLRMKAHSSNASQLAHMLDQHASIEKVFFSGLSSHPQYELAKRQQKDSGGIVSFRVKGGKEEAWKLIDQTRILSITANLGDTKTTITHPASTTHGRLTDEQKASAGITDNLIRIAVGLEDIEDIMTDVSRGLES
ncbi:MAG: O-succinylhomoserine sulfhydrylase [Gammaproteobacteria bacterium]|nr:O-succinylhomoserine sulfhydrylase [Gammaproteobacteria bacterium]MBT4449522.1 O-succinylhomoserine sulfhydrylase [Gammaproteobacteria bacterium]MBT6457242.1 O-succinylhomoserine sulfhydrylase [Gammaproteobacteria bacterium]MBT7046959.1 O-succinylhomoserine sulfhydrylase [Gammaproteobacteria bacterium]